MSYVPSERISHALANASVGVWVERLADERTALVCKIPETAIKALLRGADASLLMALVQTDSLRLLCLGMTVRDEVEHPFAIQKPTVSPEDITLLVDVLSSGSTTLHCMNELNHPALSAWCHLEHTTASTAARNLAYCDPWVLTPESSGLLPIADLTLALESAMKRFQQHIFRGPTELSSEAIKSSARILLTLDFWKTAQTIAVTATTESDPFAISDANEGQKLEKPGQVVVEAMYPGSSHHSPLVQDGATKRELIDLLGFDAEWLCVIEAKALSMLQGSSERLSDRRKANIIKDIRKGLGQLGGALKNIRSGAAVFRADGTPLTIPNAEAPAHAIVLLSEMYSFVDWRAVAHAVREASEHEIHRAFFHVFDLQELVSLANGCDSSAKFSNRLMQRWFQVQEKGTAYSRARPSL